MRGSLIGVASDPPTGAIPYLQIMSRRVLAATEWQRDTARVGLVFRSDFVPECEPTGLSDESVAGAE